MSFTNIDASKQSCITDDQAQFFREQGLLVIRNVIGAEELALLQAQTMREVERAAQMMPSKDAYKKSVSENKGNAVMSVANTDRPDEKDYLYQPHKLTGELVPFRVEYIIDKCPAARALLGHPFILRSVEKLQGKNFIPTWDSMVFKMSGGGAAIPWHRDDDSPASHGADTPIFNVDFYLDEADMTNCLWGILGSNKWGSARAKEVITKLNADGFKTDGAAPIPMKPGDVIFHNIHALHGSPAAQSKLRRVVYYEFRPVEVEEEFGPHTPNYVPIKREILDRCLSEREKAPYAREEEPYRYEARAEARGPVDSYRIPHESYWRS